MLIPWLAAVLSLPVSLLVSASTVIVDDELGDVTTGEKIVYAPPAAWISGGIANCGSICSSVDSSLAALAYRNTFHGSLFIPFNQKKTLSPPSATFHFVGVSVKVICILGNTLTDPVGTANMTFSIDGSEVGNFFHQALLDPPFEPNVTVFASGLLDNRNHTLLIQNGLIGGPSSLMVLDSISYETMPPSLPESLASDSGTPSASLSLPSATATPSTPASVGSNIAKSPNHNVAIVTGIVVALAVILLIALVLLFLRQRRKEDSSDRGVMSKFLASFSSHSKQAPDIAPVPFPTPVIPAQPLAEGERTRRPRPRPRLAPVLSTASTPSLRSRISHISFNANLLVGRRRPPPPAAAPARHRTMQSIPSPIPHERVVSIQQWQRRTQEETAGQNVVHPMDMSEVDLSTHYDESSATSPPPPAQTGQPPVRRFTVMNN
ncbi:unnamed protein product [Mycena citricolor]|uniref:Uncharacterized protein n=1 Tax=Mycena citricolor TaxID=2018698 RepID=A0AAD2K5H4_9AGAR|nr:unnamed protein product [Mycena citricolor]CAK5279867.1 unnamed protein product [Mycena citricolor]